MKIRRILALILTVSLLIGVSAFNFPALADEPVQIPDLDPLDPGRVIDKSVYMDPTKPIEVRVQALLSQMTLREKVGQTTQLERENAYPSTTILNNINKYYLGSILSGGGATPPSSIRDGVETAYGNTLQGWIKMIYDYQDAALATPLGIPLIYEIDAVHGDGNVSGVTIFPHNSSLGAANDPVLMEKIGKATAEEMRAVGHYGNFAPCIPWPQNVRWGRSYEGYGDSPEMAARLASAYVKGLQGGVPADYSALNTDAEHPNQYAYLSAAGTAVATMKHYFGEGQVPNGVNTGNYNIPGLPVVSSMTYPYNEANQLAYDTLKGLTPQQLLAIPEVVALLEPYKALTEAGARSMMPSYNSLNGVKMHDGKAFVDLLKLPKSEGGLGFTGFVVSDYNANGNAYGQNAKMRNANCFNSGTDLAMVVSLTQTTAATGWVPTMIENVKDGSVTMARLDDAVARILRVKFELGLFENPKPDVTALQEKVAGAENMALAREAVQKSLILLKNDNNVVGTLKDKQNILVAGRFANNMGMQSGGWTIQWQGVTGASDIAKIAGTTVLNAMKAAAPAKTINFSETGAKIEGDTTNYDAIVLCIGESPYAEGSGDAAITAATSRGTLQLDYLDWMAIQNVKANYPGVPVIALDFFARPMIVGDYVNDFTGWVHAGWIGSSGEGVSDVLLGDADFTGKTTFPWAWYSEWVGDYTKPFMFPNGFGLKKGETGAAIVPPAADLRQGAPVEVSLSKLATIANNAPVYGKSGNISMSTRAFPSGITGNSRNAFGEIWVEYKIGVKNAGRYSVGLEVMRNNNANNGGLTVAIDGGDPVVYAVDQTPNNTYRYYYMPFDLTTGDHVLRVRLDTAACNVATTIRNITIGTATEQVLVTPNVENIAAGYNANITISAEAPDGADVSINNGSDVIASGKIVGKSASFKILNAPAAVSGGAYSVTVLSGDDLIGTAKINVINPSVNVWKPDVVAASNALGVRFFENITINPDKFSLKLNGKLDETIGATDRVIKLKAMVMDLNPGQNTIVVTGVKYSSLFPSYSFTFTINFNDAEIAQVSSL